MNRWMAGWLDGLRDGWKVQQQQHRLRIPLFISYIHSATKGLHTWHTDTDTATDTAIDTEGLSLYLNKTKQKLATIPAILNNNKNKSEQQPFHRVYPPRGPANSKENITALREQLVNAHMSLLQAYICIYTYMLTSVLTSHKDLIETNKQNNTTRRGTE